MIESCRFVLGLKLQDPSGSYLDSPGSKAVPSSPLRAERGCLSPSLPGFFMDFSVDVSHQRHFRCFCHLPRPHFFSKNLLLDIFLWWGTSSLSNRTGGVGVEFCRNASAGATGAAATAFFDLLWLQWLGSVFCNCCLTPEKVILS